MYLSYIVRSGACCSCIIYKYADKDQDIIRTAAKHTRTYKADTDNIREHKKVQKDRN